MAVHGRTYDLAVWGLWLLAGSLFGLVLSVASWMATALARVPLPLDPLLIWLFGSILTLAIAAPRVANGLRRWHAEQSAPSAPRSNASDPYRTLRPEYLQAAQSLREWGLAPEQIDGVLAHQQANAVVAAVCSLETVMRDGSEERWREELGRLVQAEIAPILRGLEANHCRCA